MISIFKKLLNEDATQEEIIALMIKILNEEDAPTNVSDNVNPDKDSPVQKSKKKPAKRKCSPK